MSDDFTIEFALAEAEFGPVIPMAWGRIASRNETSLSWATHSCADFFYARLSYTGNGLWAARYMFALKKNGEWDSVKNGSFAEAMEHLRKHFREINK